MGCVVIADRTPSLRQLGFEEGRHFVGYDPLPTIWHEGVPEPEMLIREIRRIRDTGDNGMSIHAQDFVRGHHTWTHRMEQLLKTIGAVA